MLCLRIAAQSRRNSPSLRAWITQQCSCRLRPCGTSTPSTTWRAGSSATVATTHEVDLPSEAAAQALGVTLQFYEVREPEEFEGAFTAMTKARAEALLVLPHPFIYVHARRIADLAAQSRLPAVYGFKESVEAGGLMAYATNTPDMFRRAATYVHKILKGAKPADLPVEQPTKFELVINLTTAKALGLTIPQSLLSRADEVIQ